MSRPLTNFQASLAFAASHSKTAMRKLSRGNTHRQAARSLDEARVRVAEANTAKPGFNDKFINPRHERPH